MAKILLGNGDNDTLCDLQLKILDVFQNVMRNYYEWKKSNPETVPIEPLEENLSQLVFRSFMVAEEIEDIRVELQSLSKKTGVFSGRIAEVD